MTTDRTSLPATGRLFLALLVACSVVASSATAATRTSPRITVVGLPAEVSGTADVEVRIDAPVTSLRTQVPGILDRTETATPFTPFGPDAWDTTAVANGQYVMTVTATLTDGTTASATFNFRVENAQAAPTPEPDPVADADPQPEPDPAADAEPQPEPVAPQPPADLTIEAVGLPAVASGDVRAEIVVSEPVLSVRMTVPGLIDRVERMAPYGLLSDHRGALNPWDTTQVPDGNYTLTATVVLANGSTATQTFDFAIANAQADAVTDEPDPQQPEADPNPVVVDDAPTIDPQPAPVEAAIDVRGLPSIVRGTVVVEIAVSEPVRLVRMVVPGLIDTTERHAPYGLLSDHRGKLNPWDSTTAPNGEHRLTVSAILTDGSTVTESVDFVIDNPVADASPTPDPGQVELVAVGLPDVATGNIYVEVTVSESVQSVRMVIPGVVDSTERQAPYGLMSDRYGVLNPLDTTLLANGQYTLTATATLLNGDAVTRSFGFTVDNPTLAPSPEPTPDNANADEPDPIDVTPPTVDNGDAASPDPQVPGDAPMLQAGSGFTAGVDQPDAVGSPNADGYDAEAIARWNVVPEQEFTGEFGIGVLAFHVYGIDRVEFSVDGGPWVAVTERSHNPRTETEEYWVKLDAADFPDGRVQVRAVAYPNVGRPTPLSNTSWGRPLVLFANSGGALSFPRIELPAGTYQTASLVQKLPSKGWLTITAAPGVDPSQVVLRGDSRWDVGRVRFKDLTIEAPARGGSLAGPNAAHDSDLGWIWLDNVTWRGAGHDTNWTTHLWNRSFFTDCDISETHNVFHGTAGLLLSRNNYIHNVVSDVYRAMGLSTGDRIENVDPDRGVGVHPDMWEFASGWTQWWVIMHDIKITNAKTQGFAGAHMRNVVFKDVELPDTLSNLTAFRIGGELTNVLIEDTNLIGSASFNDDTRAQNLVIRNSKLGFREPFLPSGVDKPGITVLPVSPSFD